MAIRFESTSGPFYWYRKSEMVMFKDRFYSIHGSLHENVWVTRVFQTVLSQTPVPVASITYNPDNDKVFPRKYFIKINFPIEFEVSPFSSVSFTSNRYCIYDPEFEHGVFFDRLTAPMKKIQRTLAHHTRLKIQARRLALAMCSHTRLGECSAIQMIGSDLLRAVSMNLL